MENPKKDKYNRPMPNYSKHPVPVLTVDAIVTRNNSTELLMITRGKSTEQGKLAFPGGHVDYNENPEDAAIRELKEETGIIGKNVKLMCVRGDPLRDPRAHYVSIVYKVETEGNDEPKADDDADDAQFYKISELKNMKNSIAFDHYSILLSLFP